MGPFKLYAARKYHSILDIIVNSLSADQTFQQLNTSKRDGRKAWRDCTEIEQAIHVI